MTVAAPTPTIARMSMCGLSAGELTGILDVGLVVVAVVDFEDVEVAVVVVVGPDCGVDGIVARTQLTPLQVYPGPKFEVQNALGEAKPPQPPTIGVEMGTQLTPLQV